MMKPLSLSLAAAIAAAAAMPANAQQRLVTATLDYHAPVSGAPAPNFSPKGTQVSLTPIGATAALPAGSTRPAKTGMVKVGPDAKGWIPILVTADADHPHDLTRLYVDQNRNGNFTDDGPALTAHPSQNAKTHAWWTSINGVTLSVPYPASKTTESFLVNFWSVREDSAATPDVIRYSTGSWRSGTVTIDGIPALVAMMDDNDAIFDKSDMWSVLPAAAPNAARAVLSIDEARATNRLMYLTGDFKDVPLKFVSVTPDGRTLQLEVLDRALTKVADRAPDDLVADERRRPRASTPFTWSHGNKGFNAALAAARSSGKKILLDFEAVWCGPCHTMDQWIWNDAEVVSELTAGFIGVKIDVDDEKELVKRFNTTGYPTMIILDPTGKEIWRKADYQSSKQMLEALRARDRD
jgi:thiol-disulfide isomerase/thioredoxin